MNTPYPVVTERQTAAPSRMGARNGIGAGGDGPIGGGDERRAAGRGVSAGTRAWPAGGAKQPAGRVEHVRRAGGRPRARGGAAWRIAAGDVHGRGWLWQDQAGTAGRRARGEAL